MSARELWRAAEASAGQYRTGVVENLRFLARWCRGSGLPTPSRGVGRVPAAQSRKRWSREVAAGFHVAAGFQPAVPGPGASRRSGSPVSRRRTFSSGERSPSL